jgi:polyhydroxyalkanoate synthesis regulator phasin
MVRDDRFKRYQDAGAEFLEAARARAEEFLRELAQMGDSTQKQAQDAVDDMVEGGRKGTEQILTSIRREIRAQLSQLGLATKDDLVALEDRLAGGGGGSATPGAATGSQSTVAAPGPTPAEAPAASSKKPATSGKKPTTSGKKTAGTRATAKKGSAAEVVTDKAAPRKVAGKKGASAKKAAGEV